MVTLTLIFLTLAMLIVARLKFIRGFSRVTFWIVAFAIVSLAVSCGDNSTKYAGRYSGENGGVEADYSFKVSVADPSDIGVKGATSGESVDVIGDAVEGDEVTVKFNSGSGVVIPTPEPTGEGGGSDTPSTPISASNETGGCGRSH